MKQEYKNLLLQDLCARLPYGVKCVSGVDDAILIIEGINPNCCGASEVQVTYEKSGINFDTKLSSIKPYLFPISSMTEEQKEEYGKYYDIDLANSAKNLYDKLDGKDIIDGYPMYNHIDLCNKNHFDYRGLIPKGLAIDATGLNIY